MSHDAIVIGAGANGLVAAHTLARAGRKVLVLEQQTEASSAPDAGWIPAPVAAELGLVARGLVVRRADPWARVALAGGGTLDLSTDMKKSVESIRRLSPKDAAKWPEFCARMRRLGGVLEELYAQNAPDVETTELGELARLGLLGMRVRRLGRRGMIDLLRVLPMPVSELLDEWFENDALKAVLGVAGVMHLRQGPRSGGTAFHLLHHHVGSPAGVFRPPESNLRAILASGIEIRRGAKVERIAVRRERVSGVALAGGETIEAAVIASSADPRRTLLDLLEPGWLDPDFGRAVRNIKCRGVAARVTFTLDRPADFGTLTVASSLDHLERAYDDTKYGRASANPWLEAHAVDSRIDVHVQYVPHTLTSAGVLGDLVAGALFAHLPALKGAVTGREVLTPRDLEERYGWTEGQAYHGELTLDQILFMRPVAGWSRYRTPIGGLYLCGAGTHPGGAIAGGAGWLAAREMLRDVR